MGCYVFDYGNNLRGEAYRAGLSDAFTYPGFVPAYIRPLFCRGIGPFRWAALSGDPADIADDRSRAEGAVPRRRPPSALARARSDRVAFQGLPARICWLGYGDRAQAGLAINALVRSGAGVGAGRDREGSPRLRLGRVALSRDGGDARRLGCDRGLADPERPPQHRRGSDVGERPPRRRRGDRQLDPRGHGRASPTAPRTPTSGSSGCSPPTRAPA